MPSYESHSVTSKRKARCRRRRKLKQRLRGVVMLASGLSLAWSGSVMWGLLRATPSAVNATQESATELVAQARQLLEGQDIPNQDDLIRAQELLQEAVTTAPDHQEAQCHLIELLRATGQTSELFAQLHQAVPELPELRLILAQLYQTQGNDALARDHAQQVIKDFRTQALANPRNVTANILWAEAALLLKDYRQVEEIIERGSQAQPDPEYDQILINLRLASAQQAIQHSPPQLITALDAWQDILKIDSQHPHALQQLVPLIRNPSTKPRVITILNGLLEGPTVTLPVYQTLSGLACEEKRWSDAVTLCQDGLKQHPAAHGLMNNLAWALAHSERRASTEALTWIERALQEAEGLPARVEYLATRGSLLTLNQEWQAAIPDLEAVLSRAPDRKDTRESLGLCYRQLGQTELASTLEQAWPN